MIMREHVKEIATAEDNQLAAKKVRIENWTSILLNLFKLDVTILIALPRLAP